MSGINKLESKLVPKKGFEPLLEPLTVFLLLLVIYRAKPQEHDQIECLLLSSVRPRKTKERGYRVRFLDLRSGYRSSSGRPQPEDELIAITDLSSSPRYQS